MNHCLLVGHKKRLNDPATIARFISIYFQRGIEPLVRLWFSVGLRLSFFTGLNESLSVGLRLSFFTGLNESLSVGLRLSFFTGLKQEALEGVIVVIHVYFSFARLTPRIRVRDAPSF